MKNHGLELDVAYSPTDLLGVAPLRYDSMGNGVQKLPHVKNDPTCSKKLKATPIPGGDSSGFAVGSPDFACWSQEKAATIIAGPNLP